MKRILIVDDDRENIQLLEESLPHETHSFQTATDAESTMHRIRAWNPQLILLDLNLPGVVGTDLISRIRTATADDYTAIVVISGTADLATIQKSLDAGADDYLVKPFRPQDVVARVRSMLRYKELQDAFRRSNHRIDELVSTDETTGLLNMKALYRKGEEEIQRAKRFRKSISALLINLDQFVTINQGFGFVFGSKVLSEVAERLKQCVRNVDLVARVGADEFFIVLVETDLAGAEFMAERIKDAIQSEPYKSEKQSVRVTACIGVAGITPDQTDQKMNDLFHIASEALRSAKAAGSNHIEVYSFA